MTKREIAALICKVLGIYAFISTLNSLPLVIMPALAAMTGDSAGAASGGNLAILTSVTNTLPLILKVLVGLILWFKADSIAGRMVKDADSTISPVVIGPGAQIVAFSALGLFTLLQVIPRFAQMAVNLYMINQQDAIPVSNLRGTGISDFVALIVQFALGLWLLLGTSGLVKTLQSFRAVGMDEQNRAAVDTH